MSDKQCPNCGLWNTEQAVQCECGYEFDQAEDEDKLVLEEEGPIQNPLTTLNLLTIIFVAVILLAAVFLPWEDHSANITVFINGHALNDPSALDIYTAIGFDQLNWFGRITLACLVLLPVLGFLTLFARPLNRFFSLLIILASGALLVCMIWPLIQYKRDSIGFNGGITFKDIFTLNINDTTRLGIGFILVIFLSLILIGLNGISLVQRIFSGQRDENV